jgi:hypothetical protein
MREPLISWSERKTPFRRQRIRVANRESDKVKSSCVHPGFRMDTIYIAARSFIVYIKGLNFGRREALWFFIFSQGVNQA